MVVFTQKLILLSLFAYHGICLQCMFATPRLSLGHINVLSSPPNLCTFTSFLGNQEVLHLRQQVKILRKENFFETMFNVFAAQQLSRIKTEDFCRFTAVS